MPTTYEGREDEFDLGDGHSFAWMTNHEGNVVGLIEHHPQGPDATTKHLHCGGYIAWVEEPAVAGGAPATVAKHHLARGGPGEEQSLTVTPSLLCSRCGSHGFITDGRWVAA